MRFVTGFYFAQNALKTDVKRAADLVQTFCWQEESYGALRCEAADSMLYGQAGSSTRRSFYLFTRQRPADF